MKFLGSKRVGYGTARYKYKFWFKVDDRVHITHANSVKQAIMFLKFRGVVNG